MKTNSALIAIRRHSSSKLSEFLLQCIFIPTIEIFLFIVDQLIKLAI
jgi:hypothetical protein